MDRAFPRVICRAGQNVVYPLLLEGVLLLLMTQCGTMPQKTTGSSTNAVATERYDDNRTGAVTAESVLTPQTVNASTFGKLWSYAIDGNLQAQLLYLKGILVNGVAHNVVFAATMNDVLYALDAEKNTALWTRDFRNPAAGITSLPVNAVMPNDVLVGNIGIESTPVIDLRSGRMFLVTRTLENGTIVPRLHAIDIKTGLDVVTPVVIDASAAGTASDNVNGTVWLDRRRNQNRASLALAGGQVVVAWAVQYIGYENQKHGWVLAYDETTLKQTASFCVTADGPGGGVWMSGRAPAVDSDGNVYVQTGNGAYDGSRNFGDSLLKFSSANSTLTLVDWFTPENEKDLDDRDEDFGSGGPSLIPGTSTVIAGGKDANLYALNRENLGHMQQGNPSVSQQVRMYGALYSGPVFWQQASGWRLYVWANYDMLRGYNLAISGSAAQLTLFSRSKISAPPGDSGGVLALSASGTQQGTGIVWASMPLKDNGLKGQVQGVLRAFDADDLTHELWDSTMNTTRDDSGLWPKYSPPLVANGRVYMASFSNVVNVYGLLH